MIQKRGMRVERISITKKKTLGLPLRSHGIRLWRQRMSKSMECKEIGCRMHGGVAGVGGQPLPLCRSIAPMRY
jgi:hypothetical protein